MNATHLTAPSPTSAPTTAPAMGSPSEPEPPVPIRDALDLRARKLLTDAASALGVGFSVVGGDGESLIGEPLPDAVAACVGREAQVVDLGPACRFRLLRLALHGGPAATVIFGPYPILAEPSLAGPVSHLGRLARDLVEAGQERVIAARRHAALLDDADAELHHQNERLELAVTRLEALDKIRSNFLATVSHELRTPLTSVIGYSEMLLEGLAGALNGEQTEYVRTVMEKGEQLLAIIQGILDISRIEAGGVTLDRTRFDVADPIQSALTTVTPAARRKRLRLETELDSPLPQLYADRDKVRQVLINLVGNAVKFTPEGGRVLVRAELSTLRRTECESDPRPSAVRIAVSDSGIGIPASAMARIFDPFFQVDGSSTREYGGTGLGLSIVKSFIDAHGGRVWVESAPGSGSTFFFTLPLDP